MPEDRNDGPVAPDRRSAAEETARLRRTAMAGLVVAVLAGIAAVVGLVFALADADAPVAEDAVPTFTPVVTEEPEPDRSELPADFATCDNPQDGFAIGYPQDWSTIDSGPDACRIFDRAQAETPQEATEFPLGDMNVDPGEVSFEQTVEGYTEGGRVLLFEETEVAGEPAVRLEILQDEDGLYPAGTVTYAYVVDREGLGFVVRTTVPPDADDLPENRIVVDRAVSTLSFL